MGLRLRPIVWIVLALIVFGIVLPTIYAHWLETGSIAGLGMPLPLTVLIFCALGLFAFLITLHIEKRIASRKQAVASGNSGPGRDASHRKLPLANRISRVPSFGLLYATILGSVLVPCFWLFFGANASVGIPVRLVRPGPLRVTRDFITPPPVVRIASGGASSSPQVYLNSRPVGWEDLAPLLKSDLKSRAEWFVYVEADSDVAWGDAVNAMDIIRGTGAQVVLLTIKPTPSPANPHGAHQR